MAAPPRDLRGCIYSFIATMLSGTGFVFLIASGNSGEYGDYGRPCPRKAERAAGDADGGTARQRRGAG